eukprot:357767-Chlamydomonas_euryale.AAC.2
MCGQRHLRWRRRHRCLCARRPRRHQQRPRRVANAPAAVGHHPQRNAGARPAGVGSGGHIVAVHTHVLSIPAGRGGGGGGGGLRERKTAIVYTGVQSAMAADGLCKVRRNLAPQSSTNHFLDQGCIILSGARLHNVFWTKAA